MNHMNHHTISNVMTTMISEIEHHPIMIYIKTATQFEIPCWEAKISEDKINGNQKLLRLNSVSLKIPR